jgi:GT2 family glycosyltransferase
MRPTSLKDPENRLMVSDGDGKAVTSGAEAEAALRRPQVIDLSIVIVNWNTRDMTLDCLRSMTAQLGAHSSQIIVVDNCSHDDSVEAILSEFPAVTVMVNQENLGFAKANNRGMRECTGHYVCLINSDVLLRDGCLPLLYDYMEHHPEIGVLGPRILNRDLTLQESCKQFPTLWNSFCRALALDTIFPSCRLFSSQLMKYWSHEDTRPVDILSGCFWMVRREALEAVGRLDERFFMYAEDKDWCKRYWSAGWPVVYYPGAEAIHLAEGSSSRDPVRFYLEMNRANLRYWRKHYGLGGQLAIHAILLLHNSLRIFAAFAVCVLRPSQRESAFLKLRRSTAVMKSLLSGALL